MALIAVTRRLPKAGMDRLDALGSVFTWAEDRPLPPDRLLDLAPEAEVLVTQLSDPIDARVFDARPRLRLIAQFAVGFNNIDLDAAKARGVVVTNTPGVLTEATADLAMALLLAAARRIVEGDHIVRRGEFTGVAPEFHLGYDLQDRVLGIYGLGRIGEAVARRAIPFGLRVLYHNRRPRPDLEKTLGIQYAAFDDLAAQSDFLSINAPLTPETHHRFTLKEFGAMKPTAVLINTGRGPIVKEADLAEALAKGMIGGAALDVYEFEPQIHPGLLDRPNVVLAPHVGSATRAVRDRMARMVAENVAAFLGGTEPPNRVV